MKHSCETKLTSDDVRDLVTRLEQRAFCYDSPSDYLAGIEALAAAVSASLEDEPILPGSGHRRAG